MGNIIDSFKAQLDKYSPDEIKAQLAKLKEQQARQKEKNQLRLQNPEAKAKRAAYNATRNANPDVQAKRKAYHEKPEVKARMTEYRKRRNEMQKALIAKAKELGLIPSGDSASA